MYRTGLCSGTDRSHTGTTISNALLGYVAQVERPPVGMARQSRRSGVSGVQHGGITPKHYNSNFFLNGTPVDVVRDSQYRWNFSLTVWGVQC